MLRVDIDEIALVSEAEQNDQVSFNIKQLGYLLYHDSELLKTVLCAIAWRTLMTRNQTKSDPEYCEGVLEEVENSAQGLAELIVDTSDVY